MLNDRFAQELAVFLTLNPDQVYSRRLKRQELTDELLACSVIERSMFLTANEPQIADILVRFLDSPVKRSERAAVESFLHIVDKTAEKLALPRVETPETLALVPAGLNRESLTLIRETAEVPLPLYDALDAAERRSRQIETVLVPLFTWLLAIDPQFTFDWQLNFLNTHQPADPDVVRDFARSWSSQAANLPLPILEKLLDWAESDSLRDLWPTAADAVETTLYQWQLAQLSAGEGGGTLFGLLRRYAPFTDRKKLNFWMSRGLETLVDHTVYFSELEKSESTDEKSREIVQREMAAELRAMLEGFAPLLTLSHRLISEVNGAEKLAMSLLGFSPTRHKRWKDLLHRLAVKTIRLFFLKDLQQGTPVIDTIRKLARNDEQVVMRIEQELDLRSKSFDSVKQRDKVTELLAWQYSSYREEHLLQGELSRQYRRMMRMLHADNLNRLLGDLAAEFTGSSQLLELSALINSARNYMTIYHSLEPDAQAVETARDQFLDEVTRRRHLFLKRRIASLRSNFKR